MKQITKYQADDGKIFDTEKDCLEYEKVLEQVNQIMKPFGKRPTNISFSNGGGYIQHKESDVVNAKISITNLGNKIYNVNASFDWIGRYFDDGDYKCLYSAWGRLTSIDSKFREWGQAYYAINPSKGKQVELQLITK